MTAGIRTRQQLLHAGPQALYLYADASYSVELGVGCWAYAIPGLAIVNSGIEAGCSNNRLEFAGVVHGLASVVSLDFSNRAIHVHTDSEFVVGIMEHVGKRAGMPDRKAYRSMQDLYAQACHVTAGRAVTTRRSARDPHHAACDRRAREELRRYCTNGEIAKTILLKRAEARRRGIAEQIRQAEQSLKRLESSLLNCDIEIAALRYRRDEMPPLNGSGQTGRV